MEIEEIELMTSDDEFAVEEQENDSEFISCSNTLYFKDKNRFADEETDETANRVHSVQNMEVDISHSDSTDFDISRMKQEEENNAKKQRRKERFGPVEEGEIVSENNTDRFSSERRSRHGRSRGKHTRNCGYDKAKLFKPLYEALLLDPSVLGREIAYRLEEKKVRVIVNVVRVLGSKCAMGIFEETIETQKSKGLPTADGKRRRSSGGVFLYLLKERTTKDEWDRIFKEDKEIAKKKEKKKKKIERLNKLKSKLLERVDDLSRVENLELAHEEKNNESINNAEIECHEL